VSSLLKIRSFSFFLICLLKTTIAVYASAPESSSLQIKGEETLFESLKRKVMNYEAPENFMSYKDFCAYATRGDITANQVETLLELANECSNPILFKKHSVEILPDDYVINLLWIHKEQVKEYEHLFGSNDRALQEKMVNPIRQWQKKQPKAFINFWYDSAMGVNIDEALRRTYKKLEESGVETTKIKLRDIREISVVKENSNLFTADAAVYFRVDFLKALIADHIYKSHPQIKYTIHTDCDVRAICASQLFASLTMRKLGILGFVFCDARGTDAENSFIILGRNEDTLKIHTEFLIDKVLKTSKSKDISAFSHDDVFLNYKPFMNAVGITYQQKHGEKDYTPKLKRGIALLAPQSQLSFLSGFSEEMMRSLEPALADEADVGGGV